MIGGGEFVDLGGRNYYEVLGLSRDASARDIRRAYRTLARRYHPDVYAGGDAEPLFREIADAYWVLHDPARRALYDGAPAGGRSTLERPASSQNVGFRTGGRRRDDVPRFLDDEPAGWQLMIGVRDLGLTLNRGDLFRRASTTYPYQTFLRWSMVEGPTAGRTTARRG